MITAIKYQWQLRKLLREKDNAVKHYHKLVDEAKKRGAKEEEIEIITHEHWTLDNQYQEDIGSLVTQRLLRKARKLMLPIPEHGDENLWERCQYSNRSNLTEKGIAELRATIRREEKENREIYFPWIAALTGLVGAITGLVAIILKLK